MGSLYHEYIERLSWFVLKSWCFVISLFFGTFKKESIDFFELDPAHCLSTPDYISDTMLRFNDANLKLVSDIEKSQFIKTQWRVAFLWFLRSMLKLITNF